MSAMQRNKGKRVELEVVRAFRDAGYDTARRTGEYVANDILVAVGAHDLIVEVKARKNGFKLFYDELEKGSDAVVHRADRKPFLITMPLDLFFQLRGGA